MKKKIYVAPSIKVRKVEATSLLAASGTINTGISDEPATGGGRAKSGIFFLDDANDNVSNGIQWDE